MKMIVDRIVENINGGAGNFIPVIYLLLIFLAVDIFITIFSSFSGWMGDILATKLQTYLTQTFYKHILSLDVGYFDNRITGDIVNKMYRGIESISNFVQNTVNNFLPFFLTAVITIVVLGFYSPVIALLLALLFPMYIVISHKSTIAWGKIESQKNIISDSSQGRVMESLTGIRVVKAFIAERIENETYRRARAQIETMTVSQSGQWHTYDFYRRTSLNVILFLIIAYVVFFTFNARYTIGEMMLLIQLVNQARFPLFAMSFILGQIQRADAGSKDFFAILNSKTKIQDEKNAIDFSLPSRLSKKDPMIEFQNVSFGYDNKKTVLNNISFTVFQGETLALVGESGEGKSTIINLLFRYYQPDSGILKIAGKAITEMTQLSLRRMLAVVFQESLLFSGTIRDNILYSKPTASEDDIIRAAKAANAYDFIQELPGNLDAVIGERGVKLSGGQRQRISIARAMLKDSPIIVLDEATSSLDSRSEILVQKGITRLVKNRTTIIIAHRLSTIAQADKVLVLSKGKIAQYGKPQELLSDRKGPYAQMVNLQKKLLMAPAEDRQKALQKFDIVG